MLFDIHHGSYILFINLTFNSKNSQSHSIFWERRCVTKKNQMQHTPEESRRIYQLTCWDKNNKDEDTSMNNV